MSQVDSGQKFLVCCVGPFYGKNGLRIIRIQMGNQNGDGMDGGKFGNQNWGGGRFSFQLCFQGTVYMYYDIKLLVPVTCFAKLVETGVWTV